MINKFIGNVVLILGITLGFISSAIAADASVAKEETTPPIAEGPLTLEQIPPLADSAKSITTPAEKRAEISGSQFAFNDLGQNFS